MKFYTYLDMVRKKRPLIHHITNYVTVNDCANIVLAAGASPVMADDPEEAADMTGISQALVLNIGTLNSRTVTSMLAAGKKANDLGIPVVFDPVGCGATTFRTDIARRIASEVRLSVVRGNISEIRSLCGLESHTQGVDASAADEREDKVETAQRAASAIRCVAAVTGKEDVVTDGARTILIENGCAAMAKITGTGCMCTSLTGAFCGACPEALLEAAAAAVAYMGVCGEIALRISGDNALGHFHQALFDAAGAVDGNRLEEMAVYHEI